MTLVLTVAFSLLGSVLAVLGAASVLIAEGRVRWLLPVLVGFATGTLLGGACLGMLPAALERESVLTVQSALLAGLLLFFMLERLVIWRHAHGGDRRAENASAELILAGDAVHNLMDGIIIGVAFAEGVGLGITASLAIVAHEVPQEVGDFAILLKGGMRKSRALAYNIGSSLTTVPAAVVAYLSFAAIEQAVAIVLAVGAASFLYIALADLVPSHHRERSLQSLPIQLVTICAGIATIGVLQELA